MRVPQCTSVEAAVVRPNKEGMELLTDPVLNKGSAFTSEERESLGLIGLLPPAISTIEQQVLRVLENVRRQSSDLSKYVELMDLLSRNETLFYRVVMDHIEEMMPLIYTPVVGAACKAFGHIFRRPKGLYLTPGESGRVQSVLERWPNRGVRVIVITDGERILGLGDLGANGMGIPIGKLALYTACGGVNPAQTLPVTLDVGTDSEELLRDPLYLGLRQRRLRGTEYDALVEEFVTAAQKVFPRALIQFEDFANRNAFRLLERYRGHACVFNDDIQGTAAVALAGLYSSERLTGIPLSRQTLLFHGAGEAAIGIARLVTGALRSEGMPDAEARRRCWLVDSKGLVVAARRDLNDHKREFAHEGAPAASLLEAARALKPTGLIGVSGQPGQFDEAVIREMSRLNERPVIFALSNPTANSECTAEEAYGWSQGRAVFASGSPFASVSLGGKVFVPGQGNNAYIFPGVGLGVVASGATRVTDEMFAEAAKTLAACAGPEDLDLGRLYPPLSRIQEVSARIAEAVARCAQEQRLAREPAPEDLGRAIRALQYRPHYRAYV